MKWGQEDFSLLIQTLPTFWTTRILILRIVYVFDLCGSQISRFAGPIFPHFQKSGLGPAWAQLGPGLGPACLGPAWARLGPSLGPAWAQLGPSLGPAWAQLGPGLGPAWAQLGPGLGPAWARLGPLRWAYLPASMISKPQAPPTVWITPPA